MPAHHKVGTLRRMLAAGSAAALVPFAGGAFALATAPTASAQGLGTQCAAVTTGSASWGIKESFRSYLKSPIAMGGWDLQGVGFHGAEGGPDGAFDFTAKPAPAAQIKGADADLPLEGSMVLHGHFDLLHIELSNMSIKVRGGEAQFVADFSSNTVNKPAPGAQITGHETGTQVPIATFALDAPLDTAAVSRGGGFALSGTGTITEDGNRAFGGNYGEGNNTTDRLDVHGSAVPSPCLGGDLGALAAAAPATGGGADGAGEADGGDNGGGQADSAPKLDVAAPQKQAAAAPAPRANASAGAAPAPAANSGANSGSTSGASCTADSAKGVSDARMGWGVKDSFRTYIRSGTAKGGWTTGGGAVYNSNAFVFSGADGAVDTAGNKGSLQYGGSVEFTGHGGVLDLTLANPEIQYSGNSGALIADVTSNDTEGTRRDLGRIAVADLAVNQTTSADAVDGTGTATLTAAGASALSDFYPAGTEMSPVSFKASLGGSASCADASGTSASSSASSSGGSGGAKAAALKKDGAGLGAMPEDESQKTDDKKSGRSATSLLGEAADSDPDSEEDRSIPMALASNAGVPVALAMLVIAAGALGYLIARNRRAERLTAEAGAAGADADPAGGASPASTNGATAADVPNGTSSGSPNGTTDDPTGTSR